MSEKYESEVVPDLSWSDISEDSGHRTEEKKRRGRKKKDDDDSDYIEEEPEVVGGEEPWYAYHLPSSNIPKSYDDHSYFDDWSSRAKPSTVVSIVTREAWGAAEPLSVDPVEGRPLAKVLALYTGMEPCFTKEECCQVMRKLQKHYMEEWNLSDIPWNFLVGCDGRVYEGRGWGVHPKKVNSLYKFRKLEGKSYDIAYIGPYFKGINIHRDYKSLWPKRSFTSAMYNSLRVLVTSGVNLDFIDPDFVLESQINC